MANQEKNEFVEFFRRPHVEPDYVKFFSQNPYACHSCGKVYDPEDHSKVKGGDRSTLMTEAPLFVRGPNPRDSRRTLNESDIEMKGGPVGPVGDDGELLPDAPTDDGKGNELTAVPTVDGVYSPVVCQDCFLDLVSVGKARWNARIEHYEAAQLAVEGLDPETAEGFVATARDKGPRFIPIREAIGMLLNVVISRDHVKEMAERDERRDRASRLAGGLSLTFGPRKEARKRRDRTADSAVKRTGSPRMMLTPPGQQNPSDGDANDSEASAPEAPATQRVVPAEPQSGTGTVELDEVPAGNAVEQAMASNRIRKIERVQRKIERLKKAGETHVVTTSLLNGEAIAVEAYKSGAATRYRFVGTDGGTVQYKKVELTEIDRRNNPAELATELVDAHLAALTTGTSAC